MKVSRLLGLALVAMLVVGSIVAGTYRARAQSGSTPEPQTQAQGCDVEDDDSAEAPDAQAPDTDDVQCGEQGGAEDGAAESKTTEADAVDEQTPSYAGSLTADESQTEGLGETEESAALASMASIGEDEARAAALAANPGTTVVEVELDNENGAVVYSVELSDGSDVKVDAGNAAVLFTDSGGDLEN